MESSARDSYLEAQIRTATPQRLRLMLIEAAIRFSRQTLEFWRENNEEEALESLVRARSILSELLSSIKPDKTELTQKVAGVYLFLFNSLTKAQLQRNAKVVQDTIEVLEVERETWQLVCEKMPHAPVPPADSRPEAREISAYEAEQTLAQSAPAPQAGFGGAPTGGLVIDA